MDPESKWAKREKQVLAIYEKYALREKRIEDSKRRIREMEDKIERWIAKHGTLKSVEENELNRLDKKNIRCQERITELMRSRRITDRIIEQSETLKSIDGKDLAKITVRVEYSDQTETKINGVLISARATKNDLKIKAHVIKPAQEKENTKARNRALNRARTNMEATKRKLPPTSGRKSSRPKLVKRKSDAATEEKRPRGRPKSVGNQARWEGHRTRDELREAKRRRKASDPKEDWQILREPAEEVQKLKDLAKKQIPCISAKSAEMKLSDFTQAGQAVIRQTTQTESQEVLRSAINLVVGNNDHNYFKKTEDLGVDTVLILTHSEAENHQKIQQIEESIKVEIVIPDIDIKQEGPGISTERM